MQRPQVGATVRREWRAETDFKLRPYSRETGLKQHMIQRLSESSRMNPGPGSCTTSIGAAGKLTYCSQCSLRFEEFQPERTAEARHSISKETIANSACDV